MPAGRLFRDEPGHEWHVEQHEQDQCLDDPAVRNKQSKSVQVAESVDVECPTVALASEPVLKPDEHEHALEHVLADAPEHESPLRVSVLWGRLRRQRPEQQRWDRWCQQLQWLLE